MRWHGLALLSAQFIPDLIDETTFEALWFLVPVDPLSGKEKKPVFNATPILLVFGCRTDGPSILQKQAPFGLPGCYAR